MIECLFTQIGILDNWEHLLFCERSFMYIFEKGQGLVEYALIIVLIAILVILAMTFMAPSLGNVFTSIGNTLESI